MAKTKKPVSSSRSRGRRRHLRWWIGAGVVVVAAVVGWFAYQSAANLPGASVPSQGNAHLNSPTAPHPPYNSDPPTSGPHLTYIAPWGIHESPVQRELQVHNLEDGGVMVQYHCDCPELVAKLRAIVQRYPTQVILAPYPGMDRRIALTAWGRIDKFDELDEARIERFIKAYRGIDHHPR
ncbi:MAG: DUF3105 domain-containing protein [candidate division NC10 bacterium]